MTERHRQLMSICDTLDYYRSELTSQACLLEDIGADATADHLRSIASDLEQLTFRMRHTKRKKDSVPSVSK